MARNPRYGWVVITRDLFRDSDFSKMPVEDRWAYLVGLAESAKAGEAVPLDSWHGCGVVLRQRRVFPRREREGIFARDGWACLYCGTGDGLQLDHIIPLARGGPDTLDNLQTLCGPCNRKKWAHVA